MEGMTETVLESCEVDVAKFCTTVSDCCALVFAAWAFSRRTLASAV